MTFDDAWKDHAIKSIRKPYWNEFARLDLPPISTISSDGKPLRGPWCMLHDLGDSRQMLYLECRDDEVDWEVFDESKLID